MEYGIIGEKLGHSFSKIIHEELGGYNYEIKEISKNDLDRFLIEKDFKGINVTIPYKQEVIKYLDYVDDTVKRLNACNVIVNKNGKLYGYNTDFYGVVAMLKYFDISLSNKRVAILGSGGTSNTVFGVSNYLSAKSVLKVSRNAKEGYITYEELYQNSENIDIIVNTTPVGMYPNNESTPIDLDKFNSLEAVVDVIYNPLQTALTLKAKERNIKSCSGLYMLVAQAVKAMEYFIDKPVKIDEISNYFERLLLNKENIVLTGMPTSGKSTTGLELAKVMNREFVDTDEEIIKKINGPISDFIKENGEESFRKIETEVIKEISKRQSLVIATGGGAILRKENIDSLKQNGKINFINRSLDKLIVTNDRPLSSDIKSLEKRYFERIDLYKKTADYIIPGDGTIKDNVEAILEVRK